MAQVKNNITELVFILDRSGSMQGLEKDTVGGFNAMIEKQQQEAGTAYVSTVLFDYISEVLHDRVNIKDIQPMTEKDYTVRGCTALLDAIGDSIRHVGAIHKYARPEDVPEHTMFIITTDGMENASHRYSKAEIQAMVKKQKEEYGWEFLFIGANIDAIAAAAEVGISSDRAANYCADSEGTEMLWKTVSAPISSMRCNSTISSTWSNDLEKNAKKKRFFGRRK